MVQLMVTVTVLAKGFQTVMAQLVMVVPEWVVGR